LGSSVALSYVDQHRHDLDGSKTVYEEISGGDERIEIAGSNLNARSYVGRFNFKGSDQQKKVGDLSGGERNRVHLAKLLRRGGNVLLLDEPSNDLDVTTLSNLENAILNFNGCVMVISRRIRKRARKNSAGAKRTAAPNTKNSRFGEGEKMRRAIAMWVTVIIGGALLMPGAIFADVFEVRASDSAVKMIRFPQSLTVIWNRPAPAAEKFDSILGDPATLKRTLRKIDPARIAPAALGEEFIGPVTRKALDGLGKKYDVDLLLVFRREVVDERPDFIKLRNRARVYLVRQQKLLMIPANETATDFNENNWKEKIGEINRQGLKQLAEDARKVIHSHKFEKRRSNY